MKFKTIGRAIAVVGILTPIQAGAAWTTFLNDGNPLGAALVPAVCHLDDSRALVTFSRQVQGRWRICAAIQDGENWSILNGGAPVDEGLAAEHGRPVLVADGKRGAVMVYGRIAGNIWRLFARRLLNGAFVSMNGGLPIDGSEGGDSVEAAAALIDDEHVLVPFTRQVGNRMALLVSEYQYGVWSLMSGGQALDQLDGGFSGPPSIAADGAGGAVLVYTQVVDSGERVFALRYQNGEWSRLNGGMPVDLNDGGGSWNAKVALLADGKILVVYRHYAPGQWIYRLHGVVWDGSQWVPLNSREPMDVAPWGVGTFSLTRDNLGRGLITYATFDEEERFEQPRLYSLLVDGLQVTPLNGGAELQSPTPASRIRAVEASIGSSGAGIAVFVQMEEGGSSLYARRGFFGQEVAPVAARPSPEVAAPALSERALLAGLVASRGPVVVVHNVFNPVRGESARVVCSFVNVASARVVVYSIRGRIIRALSPTPSGFGLSSWYWDGRDNAGRLVAAGVYLVVGVDGSIRETAKVVVVR